MSGEVRFKWIICGAEKEQERVLYEVPKEPIEMACGTILPPHILTAWDDGSLVAIGIKRVRAEVDNPSPGPTPPADNGYRP